MMGDAARKDKRFRNMAQHRPCHFPAPPLTMTASALSASKQTEQGQAMTSNTPQQTPDVQIANQIIDLANTRLQNGDDAEDIAAGLRHAAANFSAFAFFRSPITPKDPNDTVDAFASYFEHYLNVHQPATQPGQSLTDLVEQAKGEL